MDSTANLTGNAVKGKSFAVFGNPVLHSRSPQLYNSLFSHDRVNAYYTRILTFSGKAVCEIIRGFGLSGANITTPFKEEVLPFLDRLSPDASKLAAVNTIISENGILTGHNTDGNGITGALRESGTGPAGIRCMVAGAGGAGRAAAFALAKEGAKVVVTNRSGWKAAEIAEAAGCEHVPVEEAGNLLRDFDVLVLALPPGFFPFKTEQLNPGMVIVDANYRSGGSKPLQLPGEKSHGPDPNETGYNQGDLLQELSKQVRLVIGGNRWLLHQAVEAYRLFTGKSADTGVMDQGMVQDHKPEKIRVFDDFKKEIITEPGIQMLVDVRGLDEQKIKSIIDEEKNRAFGHKG